MLKGLEIDVDFYKIAFSVDFENASRNWPISGWYFHYVKVYGIKRKKLVLLGKNF